MATCEEDVANALLSAQKARNLGHEAVYLGRCTPTMTAAAAAQEAVDEVWLHGSDAEVAVVQEALAASGATRTIARRLPGVE